MRHKNFGAEAQLPPLHSKETSQDNSISQIMERVDSRNDYRQELQGLKSMTEQLAELLEKMEKEKTNIRSIVDVMDQVSTMLSKETEGLFDLQKQVRSQVAEMCRTPIPLCLPEDVDDKLKDIYQTSLNEANMKLKEMQAEFLQSVQNNNEKFLADLITNKGVWLSKKVFWWSAGIAYVLSLLGLLAIGITIT